LLLAIDPNEISPVGRTSTRSLAVWAAAAAAGVGLVARGRLLPTVGADDVDAWRVGPLDPSDMTWLRELAAAFPPAAHALGVPGSRPMRMRSAESLIRALWDAIADTLVRTAAAPRTAGSPAFAALEPTLVGDLADWLADTTGGLAAGARLGLRVEAVPPSPRNVEWEEEADSDAEEADRDGDATEAARRLRPLVPRHGTPAPSRSLSRPGACWRPAGCWSPSSRTITSSASAPGAACWPARASRSSPAEPSVDWECDCGCLIPLSVLRPAGDGFGKALAASLPNLVALVISRPGSPTCSSSMYLACTSDVPRMYLGARARALWSGLTSKRGANMAGKRQAARLKR
jgi:hypothetical protein